MRLLKSNKCRMISPALYYDTVGPHHFMSKTLPLWLIVVSSFLLIVLDLFYVIWIALCLCVVVPSRFVVPHNFEAIFCL